MAEKNFKIAELISTFFYVGKSKICPGTMGSIATLPLIIVFLMFRQFVYDNLHFNICPIITLPFLIIFLFFIGYYATKIYIEETKQDDPKEVVIDEVVGQLLSYTISLLSYVFFVNGTNIDKLFQKSHPYILYYFLLIMPIILFRIFDITKPLFIGWVDKNLKNAYGVMLDDVIAGLCAGIINLLLIFFLIKILF